MMGRPIGWMLLAALSAFAMSAARADEIRVEIITDIRPVSLLTFQAGEKSRQMIIFDTSRRTITSEFQTGKTSVLGFDFSSIRNNFTVNGSNFSGQRASVTAKGQTASAVGFMPDIDYQFSIVADLQASRISITGCHNEYPSYRILINGTQVYDREQTGAALTGLIGVCDINVSIDGVRYR